MLRGMQVAGSVHHGPFGRQTGRDPQAGTFHGRGGGLTGR